MVRYALAGLVILAEIISTNQDLVGNILVLINSFLPRLPPQRCCIASWR